ncbi:MAG TPA: cupin domain-containing protein [Pseudonocardiaceae bacterium]|nr:cupin domain-containing protein [Pseudonocardiaceae bacterium]
MTWHGRPVDWNTQQHEPLLDGITAATAMGEQLSVSRFALAADAVVPEHSHAAEEFGQVLAGSLRLTVDGDTWTVDAGQGFLIRGGVPHSALALGDGCDLLECYSPPRSPVPPRPQEGTP